MGIDLDVERDCTTIQSISADVLRLMAEVSETAVDFQAMDRGYFLPNEDDAAKRIYVAYRNYRAAMYDIINRRQYFEQLPAGEERAAAFLLGFGSAVLLYEWSSVLVDNYRDEEAVRDKLNEPDARYGLTAGSFDEIYRILTRVETQQRLAVAARYYETNRGEFQALFPGGPLSWVLQQIEARYARLQRDFIDMLTTRISRDLDVVPRRAVEPFAQAAYALQRWFIDIAGNIWFEERPQIPADHRRQLEELLEPGDFMIVRPEAKSSTMLIPGWWTHGAVYFGGIDRLAAIGADADPAIAAVLAEMRTNGNTKATVLEALAAGVVVNPLAESLHVDHVVAFRPRLDRQGVLQALSNAFAQYGKPYDFEFDLSRSDRVVCTEVLYRTYHGVGAVTFAPDRRIGRVTLSADDIIRGIIAASTDELPAIQFLALSTTDSSGRQRFYTGDRGFARLRQTLGL